VCKYVHMEVALRIDSPHDLGRFVRDQRRVTGWSQAELAERAQVSRRWLSDLEAGKPTTEMGLIFKVVAALNLVIDLQPAPAPAFDLDAYLDTFSGPDA
jgi:HTH-type transcriptional regulator/antitoxin HipB